MCLECAIHVFPLCGKLESATFSQAKLQLHDWVSKEWLNLADWDTREHEKNCDTVYKLCFFIAMFLFFKGLLCDLLWSDPDKDVQGWGENDRGVSFTFGADVVSKFLNRHDLDLICRAHQVRNIKILNILVFINITQICFFCF